MSYESARQLIATAAADLTLPFPAGWEGQASVQASPAWGIWNIVQGDSIPAILGTGHTRSFGFLVLQIFVQEEGGTRMFNQAADVVVEGLEATQLFKTVRGVRTEVTLGTVSFGAARIKDGMQQKNITVPFRRDAYGTIEPVEIALWPDGNQARWPDGNLIQFPQ